MWNRVLQGNIIRHPSSVAYRIFPSINHDTNLGRCLSKFTTFATPPTPSPTSSWEFDICSEEPVFPELLKPYTSSVIIGVDPDSSGAIATLRWSNSDAVLDLPPDQLISVAQPVVFDMPTEIWKMTTREKKQPSPAAFLQLLQNIAAEDPKAAVRAAIEFTTPTHLSGKYAWYGSGFATGLITGLFIAESLEYQRISAPSWKRSLGLTRAGKEGSLALARQLFPQAAEKYLKRKKDHGRAEALLIAAWALGVRAAPCVVDVPSSSSTSEVEDTSAGDSD
ncbi:hypothetical protein Ndes2437B_g01358 [Nannochloris sp. 'desiccata']|nr:hypothetical protein KSW81_006445 [Chlorella desiccata (nom. nud.)]